ncbi:MAG: glycosyltransferase family 2 protein [Pseudomonadota bacterium]
MTSPQHPDASTLAGWNILRLMQEVEIQGQRWTARDHIALYRLWLAGPGHPDAYAGHFNLGALYQQQGLSALAEAEYRAVLQLNDLGEARYNLGLLMEQDGRLYEAMAEWRTLVPARDNPSPAAINLQALNALIRVARRTGQHGILRDYLAHSLALLPQQPELASELQQIDAGALDANGDPGVICVVAVCFNEGAILPFFLDHYINFVGASKIVLHDGGSTDDTAQIAARYPQVELVVKTSEKLDDRELMAIRNEEWKKYRNECDWMVVCDVDEFIYHPQLRAKLAEFKRDGITLPMVEGFEMLSKQHPQHVPGRFIWQDIQAGNPNPAYYNKNLIFDPVIDINYTLGCHHCEPTGPVKRSDSFIFKNLHYRMLSHRHIVEKSRRAAARLSDWNKQTNAGFHYRINAEMQRADYNKMFVGASNVVEPRARPALQRAAFETVLQYLLALDDNAVVVEQSCMRGFGHGNDSGSTELLAWYAHSFGGALLCVEPDPLALRNARHVLAERGLGRHVELAATLPELPPRIDLLLFNATDYLGDASDRAACERAALAAYEAYEARLGPQALVVLDGIEGADFRGKYRLLAPHLLSRGYQLLRPGYTAIFSKAVPLSN